MAAFLSNTSRHKRRSILLELNAKEDRMTEQILVSTVFPERKTTNISVWIYNSSPWLE